MMDFEASASPKAGKLRQSYSYREFHVTEGSAAEKQWLDWFIAHNIPYAQVPYRGWAARDLKRRTVSVLVFDWNPDDTLDPEKSTVYVDRDGAGNRLPCERKAVLTLQLESEPLPFPEEE